ncbi:MAG: thioesterase [Flavobacteriaceae bacterium]|jgi:acyl-CoA thioester hydrolase|nr:thioesterase [Flavobacteriaceae bacterium]
MQVFEQFRTVSVDDIDHLNHVNNIRYLEWIQAIARLHWTSITTDQQRQSNVWVVLRHEIDYKASAYVGENIHLKTYVTECMGVTSIRIVEIYNADTQKLLVKSQTKWCLTDPESKRPKRIPEDILTIFD